MKKRGGITRRIAADALFTALGLIVFMIESLIPSVIPGAKLGLANIFSLTALILFGPADAFAVVAARTLLGAAFAGNFSALMYSFTGGMAAMAVSALLICLAYPKISVMAVSIVAAVAHNIVQNLVFIGISATQQVAVYLPYLALLGVLSGAVVGAVVMIIFKRIPLSVYQKVLSEKEPERNKGQA